MATNPKPAGGARSGSTSAKSSDQAEALASDQIQALQTDQVQALATASLPALATDQIQALQTDQVQALAPVVAADIKAPAKAVELSAAEAAKRVKRLIPKLDEKGRPTGEAEAVDVAEDELFAWSLRGERVIVVTRDGQKLEGVL